MKVIWKVKVLIEKGMDMNGRVEGFHCTALMEASEEGRVAIVEYLYKHPSLKCINAQTLNLRRTALHLSCIAKNIQVTKLLLDAGADPKITDKDGTTPYGYAMYNNYDEGIALLQVGR